MKMVNLEVLPRFHQEILHILDKHFRKYLIYIGLIWIVRAIIYAILPLNTCLFMSMIK